MPGRDIAATRVPDPADAEDDLLARKGSASAIGRVAPSAAAVSQEHAARAHAGADGGSNLLAKKGGASVQKPARTFRNYDHKASLDVAPPPESGRSPDMEEPEGSWYKYDGAAPAPAASLFELDENAPTSWYKYEPDPVRPAAVKSDLAAPASLSIRGFARASAPPEPQPVEMPDEAWEAALAASTGEASAPVPAEAAPDVPAAALQEALTQALAASRSENAIAPALPAMDAETAEASASDLLSNEAWSDALAASAVEAPGASEPSTLPTMDSAAARDFLQERSLRDAWEVALAVSGVEMPGLIAVEPLAALDAAAAEAFARDEELSDAWGSALSVSTVDAPFPPEIAPSEDHGETSDTQLAASTAAPAEELPLSTTAAQTEVAPSAASLAAPVELPTAVTSAQAEPNAATLDAAETVTSADDREVWEAALAASAVAPGEPSPQALEVQAELGPPALSVAASDEAPALADLVPPEPMATLPDATESAPREDDREVWEATFAASTVAPPEEHASAPPPIAAADEPLLLAVLAPPEPIAAPLDATESASREDDGDAWEPPLAASVVAPEQPAPPALEPQAEAAPLPLPAGAADEPLLLAVLAPPEPIAAPPDATESAPREDDGDAWEPPLATSVVAPEQPAPYALEPQAEVAPPSPAVVVSDAPSAFSPSVPPEPIAAPPDAAESTSREDDGDTWEFALAASTVVPEEFASHTLGPQAEATPPPPAVAVFDEPPVLAPSVSPEPIAALPDAAESASHEDDGDAWESALAASTVAPEEPPPQTLMAQAEIAPSSPAGAASNEPLALAASAPAEPIAALPDAAASAPREDEGEISEVVLAASAVEPAAELASPLPLIEDQPIAAETPSSLAETEPRPPEVAYIEQPHDEIVPPSARFEPDSLGHDVPLAAGGSVGVAIEGEEQEAARPGDGGMAEPEVARLIATAPALAEPPRSPPPLPRGIPIYGAASAPGLRGPSGGDTDSRAALAEDLAEMIGSMLSSAEFATNAGAKAREAERLGASNSNASTDSLDEALVQSLPPPPPAAPMKRRGWTDHAMGLAVAGMMVTGGYFAYSLYFTEPLLAHESSAVVAMALLPPPAPVEVGAAAIQVVGPKDTEPKSTPAAARAVPAAKDARAKRTR